MYIFENNLETIILHFDILNGVRAQVSGLI
jgi:hypothetical protein